MCGIAGFFDLDRRLAEPELERLARAMAASIVHRGPDGEGVWTEAASGTALAHRRLSIIDLSEAGRQPMVSASGRTVISYNGEAYNYEELRDELAAAGVRFRGHSDTEALLEGIERWGLGSTLRRVNGMFALAVFDRTTRTLSLARDRLGQKPLYWGRVGRRTVAFASELKALTLLPGWEGRIDRAALAAYFRHNYVPGPLSIYEGIGKLAPGSIVTIDAEGEARHSVYWSARQVAREGLARPFTGSDAEAIDRLEALLADAVRRCMVSDVPLGAFLSGGIDSSLVAALMQKASSRPVRTFTIGFREDRFDEAPYARAVAAHLGTEHTEEIVTGRMALDLVPSLPEMYDEPFADSSQIPTHLVSRMIRQHVTVALSGDGGDELFAGYPRYAQAAELSRRLEPMPGALRRLAARSVTVLPVQAWDQALRLAPTKLRAKVSGDRLHRLSGILAETDDALYRALVSTWTEPTRLLAAPVAEPRLVDGSPLAADVRPFAERMQLLDQLTYLPDDILAKVDRASMAVALEARVPLLDHRVVEMSWRLPYRFKQRDGRSKWALRQVLDRHVPAHLIERAKMGFGVPVDDWLRGPLKDWAEDLLAEPALARDGLLDPAPFRRKWSEHLSGRRNWGSPLWGVLMLQAWRNRSASVERPAAALTLPG